MLRRWPITLGLFVSLAAVFAGLHYGSSNSEGWQLAARWTARVGFPIFILTYSASSLGRLWHHPLTRSVWRDRRWWGLGFAVAHTVHLFALITFNREANHQTSVTTLVGGGFGYVLLYAMVLTSDDAAMRALGKNWKRLHTLGIHWLWVVFFVSYLGRVFEPKGQMIGVIGTAIALGALGLRVAVWAKGRRRATA